MAIFDDITLTFNGNDYTVKSDRVMMLIAKVEDVISLRQLTSGDIKMSKLAEAYKVALEYAGAKVQTEDVYASLFGEGGAEAVQGSIQSLIMLMLPPSTYNPPEDTGRGKGKAAD